ncbi:PEP/pyruvate-binding domain-containing protein [Actinoplanes sp. NPDC023801]|uniref:PEP/pyruvate-binding domain-containing protein n=1 Tax=Actinoplanes sp. NPDC023801 TaxID=3154595 RepID=UPI0033E59CD8
MSETHIVRLGGQPSGPPVGTPVLGGKGAGLAALCAQDLPVPPAFVVTTAAYRSAVGAVADRLDAELAALDPDAGGFEAACARAREEIYRAAEGAAVLDEVAAAYRELDRGGGAGVAVRSSSAAEDSGLTSFAGEHDSYLWIDGADEVLDRVRACWASLYTERAVRYRRRAGITGDAMAVVVQRMVDAHAAGVLMTLNPVSGDRSVIVVESVWGLGEPLVSAEVTPDRFVIDKVTGEVRRRELAEQPFQLVGSAGRGTRREALPDPGAASLNSTHMARLRELGRQLENRLGHPVDVEFAVVGDEVFLLQVRPETVWSRAAPARPATAARSAMQLVLATLTAK